MMSFFLWSLKDLQLVASKSASLTKEIWMKTVLLVALLSLSAFAHFEQGACVRYTRNNPNFEWQLSGCNDEVPFGACHWLMDTTEEQLFGHRSKAMMVGLVYFNKSASTCEEVEARFSTLPFDDNGLNLRR